MRNRAKCKLCDEIIESFIMDDYVLCSCKEIGIAGGEWRFITTSRDPEYKNFLRVDDAGNEYPVQYKEEAQANKDYQIPEDKSNDVSTLPIEELFDSLNTRIEYVDKMPDHGKERPVTEADLASFAKLVRDMFIHIIKAF